MLYVSDNTLQYANLFPQKNELWLNNNWCAQEWFTGYRTLLQSNKDYNFLFVSKMCQNGYSLGKNLSNNLLYYKEIPIFKYFGECVLDCILVNSSKHKLADIFDVGMLGAEKLGPFTLILIDILKIRGADISKESWGQRQTFLKEIYDGIKDYAVKIPSNCFEHKKIFYENACSAGSKGVILKNMHTPYYPGYNNNFLRVKSELPGPHKNNTLYGDVAQKEENTAGFDFDLYLSIRALESKENLAILQKEQ